MTLTDAEVARRYGISRSGYSMKHPDEKAQIRQFVEAGGCKRTQDSLVYLMKKVYQLNVANRKRVTVDLRLTCFEVMEGCNVFYTGNLCSQDIMDCAFRLNQMIGE